VAVPSVGPEGLLEDARLLTRERESEAVGRWFGLVRCWIWDGWMDGWMDWDGRRGLLEARPDIVAGFVYVGYLIYRVSVLVERFDCG
jgi:hypothetical protein